MKKENNPSFPKGFGELDDLKNNEIPKPKTYRNLWVVLDDAENLSLEEPYGAKVTL